MENGRETAAQPRILFGGSFDPPTLGHCALVEIALRARADAELVVVVAGSPPHKQGRGMTPAEVRLELARLAFGEIARVRVSDEECRRPGLSYTVDTLARHRAELGDTPLYWLIGSDSLLDFPTWREPGRILELATVLTVPRPGFAVGALAELPGLTPPQARVLAAGVLDESGPPVSATDARTRVERGEPTTESIDPKVRARIEELGLYRGART